jgi:DinB superfamily
MLFGYLVVRSLRVIVGIVGRAPDRVQRGFAGALDATTPVFHKVNYWRSCAGALMAGPARAAAWLGRVIASAHRHLDGETDQALLQTMRFPPRWDPYFAERMSLAEVYHYATVHFDHHRRQLTLGDESAER